MNAASRNVLATANAALRDFLVVTRAHDAVHLDRDECGGLGGCALLRAEHDAERELTEVLVTLARRDVKVTLSGVDGVGDVVEDVV